MSEQMPQDQVGQTPVDPSTLTTEHGYTPDYTVYPGEEGRVLDPDQAHFMAIASKEQEEAVVSGKSAAKDLLNQASEATSLVDESELLRQASVKAQGAVTSRDWADENAKISARKYVENKAGASKLNDLIDNIK